MRTFNKTVNIQFSIDSVANMLLEKIGPEFPHRELLVESIITPLVVNGSSNDEKRLGLMLSAMFGHKNELDFSNGQRLYCTDSVYVKNDYKEIGFCTVLEVEPYRDDTQVKISFMKPGETKEQTKWVRSSHLRNLTTEEDDHIQAGIDAEISAMEMNQTLEL
jgi:hypothetical protein